MNQDDPLNVFPSGSMDDVPADLRVMVEQAIAEGRREIENTGKMSALILVRMASGKIKQRQFKGRENELLNIGPAKAELFGLLQTLVEQSGATAFAFGSDAWIGCPTQAQLEMTRNNPAELDRIMKTATFDECVERGLVTRRQAIAINVQTAERVVTVNQFYERQPRRRILWGERWVSVGPQSQFGGRIKVFRGAEGT